VGGVLWFGVDDTASTVYFPVYCANRETPPSYAAGNGSLYDFTWEAAFWVFNWVANFSYLRYDLMMEDVHKVQRELEGRFLADQPEVERAALALHERSPRLAVDYLTEYSVRMGEMVTRRWRELGEFLLVKYLDGNIKTPDREVLHPGYSERWYRHVAEQEGDRLRVRPLPGEADDGD
jgi:dipeptidase